MIKTLVVFFLIAVSVYGQISPGDLTTFHAKYEGLENCTKCHDLGKSVSQEKCLDCHKEIKTRIEQNKGYHSSSEVKSKNCWKCHSEHNGRNFEIIHFDRKKFDHNVTGFKLSGAHQSLDCEKCHKQELIHDAELKKRKDTYLGLGQKCADCHEDFHQGALGNKCSSCHDSNKFRPAPLFDHNKARFVLTGAHIKVACEKCHAKETLNGKSFQKFKGIPFANCSDCHKDVHNGKFGNICQKCHNTDGFNAISKSSFDHSQTGFALVGAHVTVKCSDCHGQNLTSKPKHSECKDCHKDFHKGQFTKDNKTTECANCHNVDGFTPSIYTIDMHNKTGFKLSGGHLATPCKNCHMVKDEWNFRIASFQCIDCHENIHKEEIRQKFMGNSNCSSCHNPDTWNKVEFDHSKTDFILSGVHKKTDCGKCHSFITNGEKQLLFFSLTTTCEGCHKDIHHGQFKENGKTVCSRCHGFDNWKASKFEHANTGFPLEGAHKKVDCSKCHKPVLVNQQQFINYKIEDTKCAACHT